MAIEKIGEKQRFRPCRFVQRLLPPPLRPGRVPRSTKCACKARSDTGLRCSPGAESEKLEGECARRKPNMLPRELALQPLRHAFWRCADNGRADLRECLSQRERVPLRAAIILSLSPLSPLQFPRARRASILPLA